MSVRERAQEVGVMKALGFTSAAVLGLIAGEAMLMGFIGGLVGLCGAEVMIAAMRNLPGLIVSLTTLSLSPQIIACALLLAGVCGFIAAVPAAWGSLRRPITECLRESD
jgi:putative ABC transport system permease protein